MSVSEQTVIDSVEFERLFVRYKPRFMVIARSYVRDPAVAEDIVTDCFVSFWERHTELPPDTNPLPYIMTSVRNRCLNYLKAQSRHLKVHGELYDTQKRLIDYSIRTLEACNPVDLFSEEVAAIVHRQLDTLPELTRSVLVGIRFMGKSYAEVAQENGITLRQTEHELQKGLNAMRCALRDYLLMAAMVLNIID